uniref:Uncharacterized protein n=1 Tax=Neobodo designis TaxID=312471 RepID=A0A7S1Q2B9_NEODS|mmetsp:Transcript_2991/g.9324  ORF Transcript_2991/g.9324 Transcript_2991/m.9324 type:complete len:571 (+) Transcript_2991:34-1746(+)
MSGDKPPTPPSEPTSAPKPDEAKDVPPNVDPEDAEYAKELRESQAARGEHSETYAFRAIMDDDKVGHVTTDDSGKLAVTDEDNALVPEDKQRVARGVALGVKLSNRALQAGGKKRRDLAGREEQTTALAEHERIITDISKNEGKFLVVGDGVVGPFMALCLRAHGIDCDLAHHPSNNDLDRGTIVLTPSATQILGDLLSVSVPSGSVVGRILVFDHVGNDMCDLDLNEFREKGESPTFFSCDRPKIEQSLLSLCNVGQYSCNVMSKAQVEKHGLVATPKGVRATFTTGTSAEYRGVIVTTRNPDHIPELTVTNEELQQHAENELAYKKAMSTATRWLEVSVPPLPELGKFEKRFTPGSQEIVELLTPRGCKMSVRPTMMATKLFYNVCMTISDQSADPRLKSTPMKTFWDETIEHWTAGVPGYVSHTMFKPMFLHSQQHFQKSRAVVFKAAPYNLPHWTQGGGRVIKVGHAVHGANYDAIDIADAQSFTDCFGLARTLAEQGDVNGYLKERRQQVMQELDLHELLTGYALKERSQFQYMRSRFGMKIMRRYIGSWRNILKNHVNVMARPK